MVYLIGHNRPMTELLAPRELDIQRAFDAEFAGLTTGPVSLRELIRARTGLRDALRRQFTDLDKQFLLSIKQREPRWDLLPLNGIRQLPAVQWKLLNLKRMSKASHRAAVDRLKAVLDSL